MKRKIKLKGFTLIELVMCISIMVLMSSVMFYDYPDSNVRINLANLTSRISLLLREAQIRGSAVDSGTLSVISGYGLYFDKVTNPSQVVLFNDFADSHMVNGIMVGDEAYNPATEINTTINFASGFKIKQLCTGNGFPTVASDCINDTLTVSFTRPSPSAHFYPATNFTKSGACIELVSPRAPKAGHTRSVQVFNSGRIITSNNGCS